MPEQANKLLNNINQNKLTKESINQPKKEQISEGMTKGNKAERMNKRTTNKMNEQKKEQKQK